MNRLYKAQMSHIVLFHLEEIYRIGKSIESEILWGMGMGGKCSEYGFFLSVLELDEGGDLTTL